MSRPKPNPARQQKLVDDWNAKFLIGQQLEVKLDSGVVFETKTTSMAWLMGGHTAVIKLNGISGGYSLERVKAVKFCSHPGCRYPDGKPCHGCGVIVQPGKAEMVR